MQADTSSRMHSHARSNSPHQAPSSANRREEGFELPSTLRMPTLIHGDEDLEMSLPKSRFIDDELEAQLGAGEQLSEPPLRPTV